MLDKLHKIFPMLEDGLLLEVFQNGTSRNLHNSEILFSTGSKINYSFIVLEGSLRVLRENEEGKEHYLYHIYAGEICAMSVSCCMNNSVSKVKVISESNAKIITIPTFMIEKWMVKYDSWKKFIIKTYDFRFENMLEAIDSIAFYKMDARVLKYLYDKSQASASSTLDITHQEIAYELNSTRVVISRLLKQLEHKNILQLRRNKIILSRGSLSKEK